jgi:hypothetical protein
VTTRRHSSHRIRRNWGTVLIPLLAFLSLGAWALASPVGSSPDDDFHLASIWCGLGERDDLCGPGDDLSEREVPRDLSIDSVCFAFDADQSGECQGADFGTTPDETIVTPRGNFENLYPPVFYAFASVFAGPDVSTAVILVRLANAALFVGLATATFLLLPRSRRIALLGGLFVATVPLGMFMLASTNPSSWAITSAALLWISVLGFYETQGRRRVGLAVVATIATVMGAGARADAAAYAVLALAGATFLAAGRQRRFLWLSILPLVLAIVSIGFYVSSSQSTAAATGLGSEPPSSVSAWLALFVVNILDVPALWAGVLGAGSLGWLDTPLPSSIGVGILGVFAGAISLTLHRLRARELIALGGLLVLLFLIPSYMLTQSGAMVGFQVQPRYIMPLLILVAGVALLGARSVTRNARVPIVVGATVLAVAHSLALFENVRRYVTGLDTSSPNLNANIEWWWPAIALSPMAVWALGSIAFTAALVWLVRISWVTPFNAADEIDSADARGPS